MKNHKGRNKKIVAQYRQHGTVKRLAKEYALATQTIHKILKNQGIILRKEQKKRKLLRMKTMIKAYKSGKEVPEIADELNLSEHRIRLYLVAEGVFKPHRKARERDKKILSDVKKGMRYHEIAKKYKVYISYASILARKNGIRQRRVRGEVTKQVLHLLKQGLTQSEVARRLKLKVQYVNYVKNKKGKQKKKG